MAKKVFDFYDKTSLKSYNLDKSMQYQLNILGTLDIFTRKHSENVANITCRLCKYLHLSKNFTEYCTICAYLHDIGKQFIPSSILQKTSNLTDEEFEIMKTHTTIGHEICMNDEKLKPYAAGTLYHHESLDGSGYPSGLTEKDIPIEGQIIRVADEFDAIVSKRQYKTHIGIVDTVNILVDECKKGRLKASIVKALIKVVIDDTEYEISCTLDYLKDLKKNIKRLEQIKKYDEKRLNSDTEKKQQYYLEGMKVLMIDKETIDNYKEVLTSYKNIINKKTDHIDKLFDEIKEIKKLKV